MHFSTVKITEGVLKVGSSLGIEEAKNASLKNLGRLSNSTPLFLKGIFRILQDFLCTDFFFCLCNFDSLVLRAKRYHWS